VSRHLHWVCRCAGRDWARIVVCWFLVSGVIVGGVADAFGTAGVPAGSSVFAFVLSLGGNEK